LFGYRPTGSDNRKINTETLEKDMISNKFEEITEEVKEPGRENG
jgi:hypothetical protein